MVAATNKGGGEKLQRASLLRESDVLFAHKALNIMPDLSEAARRVAGAIIDHFNKQTGQCDPGITRLTKLLGLNRATVIRATKALSDHGLIEKESHGGKSHRASYRPNWDLFRAIVEDWDDRMKSGPLDTEQDEEATKPVLAKVAAVRRSRSQDCDVKGRSGATQTLRINQSNKPFENTRAENPPFKPPDPNKRTDPVSLSKETDWKQQRSFLLPFSGGRKISHCEAAREAAQRRWELDAKKRGAHVYAAVAEWMTDERQRDATEAELARKGGGLEFILASMRHEQRRMTA